MTSTAVQTLSVFDASRFVADRENSPNLSAASQGSNHVTSSSSSPKPASRRQIDENTDHNETNNGGAPCAITEDEEVMQVFGKPREMELIRNCDSTHDAELSASGSERFLPVCESRGSQEEKDAPEQYSPITTRDSDAINNRASADRAGAGCEVASRKSTSFLIDEILKPKFGCRRNSRQPNDRRQHVVSWHRDVADNLTGGRDGGRGAGGGEEMDDGGVNNEKISAPRIWNPLAGDANESRISFLRRQICAPSESNYISSSDFDSVNSLQRQYQGERFNGKSVPPSSLRNRKRSYSRCSGSTCADEDEDDADEEDDRSDSSQDVTSTNSRNDIISNALSPYDKRESYRYSYSASVINSLPLLHHAFYSRSHDGTTSLDLTSRGVPMSQCPVQASHPLMSRSIAMPSDWSRLSVFQTCHPAAVKYINQNNLNYNCTNSKLTNPCSYNSDHRFNNNKTDVGERPRRGRGGLVADRVSTPPASRSPRQEAGAIQPRPAQTSANVITTSTSDSDSLRKLSVDTTYANRKHRSLSLGRWNAISATLKGELESYPRVQRNCGGCSRASTSSPESGGCESTGSESSGRSRMSLNDSCSAQDDRIAHPGGITGERKGISKSKSSPKVEVRPTSIGLGGLGAGSGVGGSGGRTSDSSRAALVTSVVQRQLQQEQEPQKQQQQQQEQQHPQQPQQSLSQPPPVQPIALDPLPAWVFCTRYSDRPSSGPRARKPRTNRIARLEAGGVSGGVPGGGVKNSTISTTLTPTSIPSITPSNPTSPGYGRGRVGGGDEGGEGGTDADAASGDDKRPRTAFTAEQLAALRREFEDNRYLTEERRLKLSANLRLSESQIKIWFQNKRAKLKKSTGVKNELALKLMEQGLYNHSTVTVKD